MATPTLIGMPEPPSNPDTPTEAPGTPNSTTTSLSALSTTAIKDGHRGAALHHAPGHHHTPSNNTLEAERADRISRLAGLERVSTSRPQNTNTSSTTASPGTGATGQPPGYFDQTGNPIYSTRMSTVGSASATGSSGGRTTTWASSSAKAPTDGDDDEREADQMSMDTNYRDMVDDRDRLSASAMDEDMNDDGMSDDTSLVGFGEGAGSTVSGPTYSRTNLTASPAVGKSGLSSQLQRDLGTGIPLSASSTATADQQRKDARMVDGVATDSAGGFVDTTLRSPEPVGSVSSSSNIMGLGTEAAERIVEDSRLDDGSSNRNPALGSPKDGELGKFYFEEKK